MAGHPRSSCKTKYLILLSLLLITSTWNGSTVANDNKPDLLIKSIDCPETVKEDDHVHIELIIENNGNKNISAGTPIRVGLYIDSNLICTNSTFEGLAIGKSCFLNVSWAPLFEDIGQHLVTVWIDYQNLIDESDENNNIWDSYVEVIEKDVDIGITGVSLIGEPWLHKPLTIEISIINMGSSTDETLFALLEIVYKGASVYVDSLNTSGLSRMGWWNISFEWIPERLGSHEINVTVLLEDDIEEWYTVNAFVDFGQLAWWNPNWHYRAFIGSTGEGEGSVMINFTALLDELGLSAVTFENETIRLITYKNDGTVNAEVADYFFNEDEGFNPLSNAKGHLIWKKTKPEETFYGIYFDVVENIGTRPDTEESAPFNESGTVTVFYGDPLQPRGWYATVITPRTNSSYVLNEPIEIMVNTTAKATQVIAEVVHLENASHHYTIVMDSSSGKTSWKGELLIIDDEEKGNWTITITSFDAVGYHPTNEKCNIYIGSPDLAVVDLRLNTNHATFPTIYETDIVTVTADVRSYFATVYNTTLSVDITNETGDSLYYHEISGITIEKDKQNNVSFTWAASSIGNYNITVRVDPNDVIQETNETNNEQTVNISVYGLPDLAVLDVIPPTGTLREFDEIAVKAIIANYGHSKAKAYIVNLYFEPASRGGMSYRDRDIVDSITVTVDKGETETITLVWSVARDGEWVVGVKVIVSDTKRDANLLNNQLPANHTITIKPKDKTAPTLSHIGIQPDFQEQGKPVTITARASDDSGLKAVTIVITNPKGTTAEGTMMRMGGTQFSFTVDDTVIVGTYVVKITAEDLSIHRNKATASDSFYIYVDSTDPFVDYFAAIPATQGIGDIVAFACVATDNIGIQTANAIVTAPDGSRTNYSLELSSTGKYMSSDTFELVGRYTFYIIVSDYANNTLTTSSKSFWITTDIDDTDGDGLPDWWEKKYKLDPKSIIDATMDGDGDGYSNLEEYTRGTNPQKDIFIQNAIVRIKENGWYLLGSLALFVLLVILSLYGKRRRSR